MEFIVYDKPCLLLETAELVHAFLNNVPAQSLTLDGPYCIPADKVAEIQNEVTKDLNPEDEELQYYFKGVSFDGGEERLSFLASMLLYFQVPVAHSEVDAALEYLHFMWSELDKPFSISGVSPFTLSVSKATQYTNLSKEICKLPIPHSYQIHLIEAFSGFDWHLERIGNILRPLAERLKPLLEPWVENAAPLRDQWRTFGKTPEAADFILKRAKFNNRNIDKLHIALRYFSLQTSPGISIEEMESLSFHMSLAVLPGQPPRRVKSSMRPDDYNVLRLLSSPDRFAVYRAVRKEPKSMQDLTVELNLNPGTVFRIVNSLYNANLLNLQVISGRNCYTANIANAERVTEHMFRCLKED
ncbi:MAG: hypothetical protein ACI3V3_01565 [Faecousia sp.]